MIVYLDTSVVLRAMLRDGPALPAWGRWQEAFTSELLGVEVRRVIDRLRLSEALDDQGVADSIRTLYAIERGIGRIALTRSVLRRASQPMGTVVRTLDAIHLASALMFQERKGVPIVFATHDAQQARGALALGLECIGF